eukprot:scaffold1794_cov107-Cylindrotheca_fusiformis.AAC.8
MVQHWHVEEEVDKKMVVVVVVSIPSSTCQHYDRAYIWHLFKANEPLAASLVAIHNIHYMNDLMKDIRQDILDGKI